MSDKEHPFEKVTRSSDYAARMTALADVAFEEGKVTYLLKAFKLHVRNASRVLREAQENATGTPNLTLSAFNSVFPSFPMYLGASRLGGIQLHLENSAMIPAMFKTFGATPFVSAFDAFYEVSEDRSGGRPVGMVFPRKGFKNGLIIYATDDLKVLPFGEREGYFAYVSGKKKAQQWLLVRSFQKTIEAIHNGGHGWRPDSDL